MSVRASRFQRLLLPGLAFKAAVIGGGYATGRELAEYFLPAGPVGGLMGMGVTLVFWSLVCALTFALAHAWRAFDYHAFFARLLGRAAFVFEVAYVLFMVLILAVFGAAAGEIGAAMFGWPRLAGTLLLVVSIALFTGLGSQSVEGLFKWLSLFLYGVYALFFVLVLSGFGDQAMAALSAPQPRDGWLVGGLTYAGYNVVGAVMVLPLARHFLSRRDALVAGLLSGPLAMLPGLLFFVCMLAWPPQIGAQALPSDYMLRQLGLPWFHLLFQGMVFCALLDSGVAAIHAVNERIAGAWHARRHAALPRSVRLATAALLLVGSIFIAARFGLVHLIARGYRALAWLFIAVYVLPLLTVGVVRLSRSGARRGDRSASVMQGEHR